MLNLGDRIRTQDNHNGTVDQKETLPDGNVAVRIVFDKKGKLPTYIWDDSAIGDAWKRNYQRWETKKNNSQNHITKEK
jgi:hypothetical protein